MTGFDADQVALQAAEIYNSISRAHNVAVATLEVAGVDVRQIAIAAYCALAAAAARYEGTIAGVHPDSRHIVETLIKTITQMTEISATRPTQPKAVA